MDLNRVTLIGRVGADPEIRSFQNGGRVASMRIATSERWKDKNTGERKERTHWHSVQVFNDATVKVVSDYVGKGSRVLVEGTLENRKFEDKDGNERWVTEVCIRPYGGQLMLLDAPKQRDEEEEQPRQRSAPASRPAPKRNDYDDDIPF